MCRKKASGTQKSSEGPDHEKISEASHCQKNFESFSFRLSLLVGLKQSKISETIYRGHFERQFGCAWYHFMSVRKPFITLFLRKWVKNLIWLWFKPKKKTQFMLDKLSVTFSLNKIFTFFITVQSSLSAT